MSRKPLFSCRCRSWPGLLFALLLLLGPKTAQAAIEVPPGRHTFSHVQMGTLFRITVYTPDSALAADAAKAAFARVDHLNQVMSDYLPDTELNRLSATAGTGQAVAVSRDLWQVLHRSAEAARRSQGAFDVTVGPYVLLWRRARRQLQLPPAEALNQARQVVGYRHLRLNPRKRTVELLVPGIRLDLGGIGKGYAVDEALKVLWRYGLRSALVDAGGNVAVGKPPPGRRGWQVATGLAGRQAPDTVSFLRLRRAAIASSGDLYQYVELAGQRYSHILDPQTGLGLTHQREVTALAPNAATADWLSTALSVLEVAEARKLLRQVRGAQASISWIENGEVQRWVSKGWEKWVDKP